MPEINKTLAQEVLGSYEFKRYFNDLNKIGAPTQEFILNEQLIDQLTAKSYLSGGNYPNEPIVTNGFVSARLQPHCEVKTLLEYLIVRSKTLKDHTQSRKLYSLLLKGTYAIWADGVSILQLLSHNIYTQSEIPKQDYMRLVKIFHRIKNYQELQHEYKRFESAWQASLQAGTMPNDQSQYLSWQCRPEVPEVIGYAPPPLFEENRRVHHAIPKMLKASKKSPYFRFKKIAASGIFDDSFRNLLSLYKHDKTIIDDLEKYPRTLAMLLFQLLQTKSLVEKLTRNQLISELPDLIKRKMPASTYRFIYKNVIDCVTNEYKRPLLQQHLKGIPKPKNLAQWHMLQHYIELITDKIDEQYNMYHSFMPAYGCPQRLSLYTRDMTKEEFIKVYNSTNNDVLKKFARDTRDTFTKGVKPKWRSHHHFHTLLLKIEDGQRIYSQNKDQTLVKFVDLSTQKTLLRQYKASIFNHKQLDRYGKILNEAKQKALFLIPMPTISWLSDALEQYRIKTKGDMVKAGQECHHCIGTYKDRKDSLFFRKDDICAQVIIVNRPVQRYVPTSSSYTASTTTSTSTTHTTYYQTSDYTTEWEVNQCYDKYDKITDASRAFKQWLEKEFKKVNIPDGGKLETDNKHSN